MNTTERLTGLEAALATAREGERAAQAKAHAAVARTQELTAQLTTLAVDQPQDFAEDGSPKAKSSGAELARQLEALRNPAVPWARLLEEASARSTGAERELARFKMAHVQELLHELEPEAREVAVEVETALRTLSEAIVKRSRVEGRVGALLAFAQGLDSRDLPRSDHLDVLRKRVKDTLTEGVKAPLPRSIFPVDGEKPRRIRSGDGWIAAQHLPKQEEAA